MGCGAMSSCKKDSRRKAVKIDYSLENTGIDEFDGIFNDAKNILQVLEECRAGLFDTLEDIKDMCEVDRLQNPTLDECIRVWMWSISACADGKILNCSFEVTDSSPYFKVTLSGCTWEAYWIEENLKKFIETALDMPEKVAKAVESIVGLVEKVSSIDPQAALENSPLDLWDKAKAIKIFAENLKKVAEGGVEAPKVASIVADAAKLVVSVAANMKQWLAECDNFGQIALQKQAYRPSAIMQLVHPGPHKTKEQIIAYEEMMKDSKCDCQKCVKEGQEQAAKDTKK